MQVPKTVTKKKYLHFASDIKRLYILFRLEAQTRAEKMNVHAESIKFLQQHCPGMEISSASRQYQDWYREMNLHLTPQEIEQYKPSGWSVTNAGRGLAKHRKVSAPSPEAAPTAISITSPVAGEIRRQLVDEFASPPPVAPASADPTSAPAPTVPVCLPSIAPPPVDDAVLTGFLLSTAVQRDKYFQRLATGSQKPKELSRADLGLVFAACSSIGMTRLEYLSRGGFGIIIATSMHGKDAVVPDTLAEDPLYDPLLSTAGPAP